jgi:hypothetical protein
VIPQSDIRVLNDFKVKNEPILTYLPGSKVYSFKLMSSVNKSYR